MSVKFDVQLTAQDMYRFNLYHAYTSSQGILSLLFGIVILIIVFVSYGLEGLSTAYPYVLIAVFLIVYVPIALKLQSKHQINASEVLSRPLHFELTEEGVVVTSEAVAEQAVLPWDSIYKAVTTRHNFLIFSNRVNAYIVPKEQVREQLPRIYDAFASHCQDYRLHIKR
jgi:hypothetical protein